MKINFWYLPVTILFVLNLIYIEIGQALSLYKDSENLSKTSQSSMRQVFGVLAGTDGGIFVGVDVNTKEVYQIKNADRNHKTNPFMMFDRVPL